MACAGGSSGYGGRGPWGALLGAALAAGLMAPLGWWATDRLEADNDFCNACHLEPGLPLHEQIRRDFDAARPASLATVHALSPVEDREDSAFRCIDCHGGQGFGGRLRVKALAAKDAFWYVVGHFEEPTQMAWPLLDADCRQCHGRFDESDSPAWEAPRFHQRSVHNVDLGVDCVECHSVHELGGNSDAYFLRAQPLRSQCARCHAEYQEAVR
ncbi:MAG: hypothetical protein VCB99_07765 [Myxococcota bacterium]